MNLTDGEKGRSTLKRTVDIPLAGIFGALVAFSYLIPISVVVGGVGIFSLSWVMQTITGILLGPYLGGGAAFAGGIVGNLIKPSTLGPLAVFLPAFAAVEAGLIVWSRWQVATLLLSILIAAWFVLPVGLSAWPAALFHLLGICIIVVLGRRLPRIFVESVNRRRVFLAWMLTAYCGDIARHMFGNILVATVLSFPAATFLVAIPQAVVEQTIFAFASAVIGVSALSAIRSANLDVPLTRLEERESLGEA
jgi:hypothetical protein